MKELVLAGKGWLKGLETNTCRMITLHFAKTVSCTQKIIHPFQGVYVPRGVSFFPELSSKTYTPPKKSSPFSSSREYPPGNLTYPPNKAILKMIFPTSSGGICSFPVANILKRAGLSLFFQVKKIRLSGSVPFTIPRLGLGSWGWLV